MEVFQFPQWAHCRPPNTPQTPSLPHHAATEAPLPQMNQSGPPIITFLFSDLKALNSSDFPIRITSLLSLAEDRSLSLGTVNGLRLQRLGASLGS